MNEMKPNRVDDFRQFKREMRSSKEYLIVGLDIAKRKHHGFFGDASGRTLLKGLIVENSAEGLRHLLTQVRFYMDREGLSKVVFGLEPTSVYHKPLAEHLIVTGTWSSMPPTRRSRRTAACSMVAGIRTTPRTRPTWRTWWRRANATITICRRCGCGTAQPAVVPETFEEAVAWLSSAHPQQPGGAVLPGVGPVLE